MLTKLKSTAKSWVGPKTMARIRGANLHARAAVSLLRGRLPNADRQFVATEAEEFLQAVQSHESLENPIEKDALAVRLMQRVAADQRYLGLVRNGRRSAGDPTLASLLESSALFGLGQVDEARSTLQQLVEHSPSERAWYCLARCDSLGSLDHQRSLESATRGLNQFPDSTLLHLVASVAAFRLGQVEEANRFLDRDRTRIETMLHETFPAIDSLQEELDSAIASGKDVRETAYSNDTIENYWNSLLRNCECFSRFQNPWASMRWIQRTCLEEAISKYAPDLGHFINFGAFCAVVDWDLAGRFPQTRFSGVDFGLRTKQLNDKEFVRPNLQFHDAFILDYLETQDTRTQPTMLFHARTGTLFYPAFMKRFYENCAQRGIRYIALWENGCLSYSKARFHDQGSIPDKAIAYRNVMFIHDYRHHLENAGYEVLQVRHTPSCTTLVDSTGDGVSADGHMFVLARLKD